VWCDGPFPTELTDETGDRIREKGHEYGVTTGRPRRIGWLDLVMVKYAATLSGFTGLAVTRMDVLAGFDRIKVAYGYRCDGKDIKAFPFSLSALSRCEPLYEEFQGWPEIDRSARSLSDLHPNARKYIEFISEVTGLGIHLVSLGRDRQDTLALEKVF